MLLLDRRVAMVHIEVCGSQRRLSEGTPEINSVEPDEP